MKKFKKRTVDTTGEDITIKGMRFPLLVTIANDPPLLGHLVFSFVRDMNGGRLYWNIESETHILLKGELMSEFREDEYIWIY